MRWWIFFQQECFLITYQTKPNTDFDLTDESTGAVNPYCTTRYTFIFLLLICNDVEFSCAFTLLRYLCGTCYRKQISLAMEFSVCCKTSNLFTNPGFHRRSSEDMSRTWNYVYLIVVIITIKVVGLRVPRRQPHCRSGLANLPSVGAVP